MIAEPATSAAAAVAAAAVVAAVVAVEEIAPVVARAAVADLADIAGTGHSWLRTADTDYSCLRRVSGRDFAGDVEACCRVVYYSKDTGLEIVKVDGRGTEDTAGAVTEDPAF